jgi:hypothetical protein
VVMSPLSKKFIGPWCGPHKQSMSKVVIELDTLRQSGSGVDVAILTWNISAGAPELSRSEFTPPDSICHEPLSTTAVAH